LRHHTISCYLRSFFVFFEFCSLSNFSSGNLGTRKALGAQQGAGSPGRSLAEVALATLIHSSAGVMLLQISMNLRRLSCAGSFTVSCNNLRPLYYCMPYQIQHYCTVGPVPARDELSLCVCLLLQYLLQSCSRGEGGGWRVEDFSVV